MNKVGAVMDTVIINAVRQLDRDDSINNADILYRHYEQSTELALHDS